MDPHLADARPHRSPTDGAAGDPLRHRSARDLIDHMRRRLGGARDDGVGNATAWRRRAPHPMHPVMPGRPLSDERAAATGAEIDHLARELQPLLGEADERLDRLGREASLALTVIKGRAQLLRRQVMATGSPDRHVVRATEEIDRAVDRLHRLLHDQLAPPPSPPPPDPPDKRADES